MHPCGPAARCRGSATTHDVTCGGLGPHTRTPALPRIVLLRVQSVPRRHTPSAVPGARPLCDTPPPSIQASTHSLSSPPPNPPNPQHSGPCASPPTTHPRDSQCVACPPVATGHPCSPPPNSPAHQTRILESGNMGKMGKHGRGGGGGRRKTGENGGGG